MRNKKIRVVVGSQNPVKIKAVNKAFTKVFGTVAIKKIKVDSGVSIQPKSIQEGYRGALNRAKNALRLYPQASFGVGIEGTIHKYTCGWVTCGVVVIVSHKGEIGIGISPQLFLPKKITTKLFQNRELGNIIDEFTNINNTKQKNGAFGFFTNNLITRLSGYEQAVIFALSRFIKKEIYQ